MMIDQVILNLTPPLPDVSGPSRARATTGMIVLESCASKVSQTQNVIVQIFEKSKPLEN